jgi:cell growth-regulating nucleolar protein
MKAIDNRPHHESASDSDDDLHREGQVVVFGAEAMAKRRCETFLSNIPGDEVGKGYSIHKALKRYHKQTDRGRSSKHEEEQELWRGLRLRKNDRGEIVVFF